MTTAHTPPPAGLLRQSLALLPFALRSLRDARWSSLTLAASVMLVVLILNFFLAMTRGFDDVAGSSGANDVAVLLGPQSQSEASSIITSEQVALLESAPGLRRLSDRSSLSPEFTVNVSRPARNGAGRVNSVLRGLSPQGLALRQGFRIVEGRAFTPGRHEVTIGRALAATTGGAALGSQLTLAGERWTVVGVHALGSAVHESEYLADLPVVQSAYRREGEVQSVRVRLRHADALAALQRFNAADTRLGLVVLTERELYQKQIEATTQVIHYLGWPLLALLSLGALAGMLNTLAIMLEGRRHVLTTLELLGFTPAAVRISVVMETMLMALAGALASLLLYLWADGKAASVVGSGYTTIQYQLRLDSAGLLTSIGVAALLGLASGVLSGLAIDTKTSAGRPA